MAKRDIVISEVLCFVVNNIVKTLNKQLKPILVSFYSEDDMQVAKDLLHKGLTDLGIANLPRLMRRKGDNIASKIADDLLELCNLIDEQQCLLKLPCYV